MCQCVRLRCHDVPAFLVCREFTPKSELQQDDGICGRSEKFLLASMLGAARLGAARTNIPHRRKSCSRPERTKPFRFTQKKRSALIEVKTRGALGPADHGMNGWPIPPTRAN